MQDAILDNRIRLRIQSVEFSIVTTYPFSKQKNSHYITCYYMFSFSTPDGGDPVSAFHFVQLI